MLSASKQGARPKQMLLINRDLQFRYVRVALVIGLVATILSGTVILWPLYQFEILRIPRFLPWPIMIGMVAALVINMVCVMFMMIVISHRVAGPVFALSREFAEIGRGVYGGQLKSRKYDDLQFLVRSFNDMSQSLKHLSMDDMAIISRQLELMGELKLKIASLQSGAAVADNPGWIKVMTLCQEVEQQLSGQVTQLKARVGDKVLIEV